MGFLDSPQPRKVFAMRFLVSLFLSALRDSIRSALATPLMIAMVAHVKEKSNNRNAHANSIPLLLCTTENPGLNILNLTNQQENLKQHVSKSVGPAVCAPVVHPRVEVWCGAEMGLSPSGGRLSGLHYVV